MLIIFNSIEQEVLLSIISCFVLLVEVDPDPKTREEFSMCESFVYCTYFYSVSVLSVTLISLS